MFTDRECDAIDAHRDLCKERDMFPLDEPSADLYPVAHAAAKGARK